MRVRNVSAFLWSMGGMVLLAPFILIGGAVWSLAALTRWIAFLMEPEAASWKEIIQYEPEIGWKHKANLDLWYSAVGDDVCHTVTDERGWVGRTSLEESQMVVFGDSFAFGYGVDIERAFFSMTPNIQVKSIGANGYSMVHGVLLMNRLAEHLREKVVVWLICVENDIYDNLRPCLASQQYRTPFLRKNSRTGIWEIVIEHVNDQPWPSPPLRAPYSDFFAKLFQPSALGNYAYSACEYLLEEGRNICRTVDASLVVMTIPKKNQLTPNGTRQIASPLKDKQGFDPDYLDHQFRGICDRLGIGFIPLKEYLGIGDYKKFDWHWNERGHQKVAQVMSDVYGRYQRVPAGQNPNMGNL